MIERLAMVMVERLAMVMVERLAALHAHACWVYVAHGGCGA